MAEWIMGSGFTVSGARFTGADPAKGVFGGGLSDGLPFDAGIILSSGDVHNAAGPNDDLGGDGDTPFGTSGDDDLDTLLDLLESQTDPELLDTRDAAVLEFDIVSSIATLEFEYIFASEEYPEFLTVLKNDAVAIFVNGENIAWVPGTTDVPVCVFTINGNQNNSFFRGNPFEPNEVFDLQYDGFTSTSAHPWLTASVGVPTGVPIHIKIVIADEDDAVWDSAVFVKAKRQFCE